MGIQIGNGTWTRTWYMDNCTWNSFEEFKKSYSSIWKVTLKPSQYCAWNDALNAARCPIWSKNFTCKKIL